MNMGVDGFRLDAVPYLYEREGTTCENLPETHGFLKKLRQHVDENFKERVLLAEANQWPEDAVPYFGDGDECHMSFHFPLMPRLFMAIQREDRFPVMDILQQTPQIPETAQWAIFLRNHDELTLEMVTDEERDYMYRSYADEPQARINLGIRRRLAPLLRNNRRKLELMNGLLLSLPGTPVLYYGDEIGMGDNIYLGDRDSVRTPMQWTVDRNAGFSRANPQKLFLPVSIDSEFHFATHNVETQQNNPHSLLWWMKRVINLRKRYQVFGRGSLEFLTPDNPKVLAYIRRYRDEVVLVVANLSRFVQYLELDLSQFRGMVPIEMFGQTRFPAIGELPYFLTMGPHGFYWLLLAQAAGGGARTAGDNLPVCRIKGDWENVFRGRAKARLQAALPGFLKDHRWFAGKARVVQQCEIRDVIPLGGDSTDHPACTVLVRVDYVEGEPETYQLPIAFARAEGAEQVLRDRPGAAIIAVEFTDSQERGLIYEAGSEPSFWVPLLKAVARRKRYRGNCGELTTLQTRAFRRVQGNGDIPAELTIHGGEQSNTSAVFGDRFILKLFRRLNEGANPDLELGRFLTEKAPFAQVPPVTGAVEYRRNNAEPMTLAVVHRFEPNEGDAWRYTMDELARYYERATPELVSVTLDAMAMPPLPILDVAEQDPPQLARDVIGHYLYSAQLLGQRTGELHVALASRSDDPAFAPETFSTFYQRGLFQSMRTHTRRTLNLLRKQLKSLPESALPLAERALAAETAIIERFRGLVNRKMTSLRIRCHGDFHLGQVLFTGKDFLIIDFEGEPERPVSERRLKRSPLRDVAGMLRSFHYASSAALLGRAPGLLVQPEGLDASQRWMNFWYVWTAAAFLKSYLAAAAAGHFLPQMKDELGLLLDAYVLEKAVYELGYELNNRPDWVRIPLDGILQLMEAKV
jgi:maltose alpha-D-glucosyltransferase/alpha-amylase